MVNKIRPFRKENIGAYLTVMAIYILLSLCIWFVYSYLTYHETQIGSLKVSELLLVLVSVFFGMMIMFGASVMNLRKLRPALQQIADGDTKINIPKVWCPVLTSASEAVTELCKKIEDKKVEEI